MKHFVIEVATTSEGTTKGITEQPDRQHALIQYYQIMASMMNNENVLTGMCSVLDATGRQLLEATQYYTKPIEQEIPSSEENIE